MMTVFVDSRLKSSRCKDDKISAAMLFPDTTYIGMGTSQNASRCNGFLSFTGTISGNDNGDISKLSFFTSESTTHIQN
jgi:hypothetical protein